MYKEKIKGRNSEVADEKKKISKAIKEKTLTVTILWDLYENSIYVGNNDKNKNFIVFIPL